MKLLRISGLLVASSALTAVLGGVFRGSLDGWPFQLMLGTAVACLVGGLATVIFILVSELLNP